MCDNNEFNITTKRFRELIDNEKYAKIPRAEIAKATDCDTSTITKYYNGQRQLSVDSIIKFSKYFNVSSDYLLGLTDTPIMLTSSDDKALRVCCDYMGLSENNVRLLHSYEVGCNMERNFIKFVNDAITNFSHIDFNVCNLIYYKEKIEENRIGNIIYEDKEDVFKEYQVLKYLVFTAFNESLNTKADEIINADKSLYQW